MEVHVGMALEPAVALRSVGVEIVQDDVQLEPFAEADDLMHEVEEISPPAAPVMM